MGLAHKGPRVPTRAWPTRAPLGPQGQAGDQSRQRSHLVEAPLGKEGKCARSGDVRAMGRGPDQPRPTPRHGFESGQALLRGFSWRFAAMIGQQ